MSEKLCSIIVRTKNEERWISSCLDAIFDQTYKQFEVIIVDNKSNDKTLEKAKCYNIKEIVNLDDYLPGKALNLGIEKSMGDYIVCISAHCIPVNNDWLNNLVCALEENDRYAGVYGRQEPMSFSTPADKRDLMLVFGLDRKIQKNDSFFHNANSIIKRKLWEKVPFNNDISNIEDRLWAQEMLKMGYHLMYEPTASVYHYHGIHQDGNSERLNNVVQIIEENNSFLISGKLDVSKMEIVAIIPIRGQSRIINNKPLITYTINKAKNSKYINRIIVSTDNKKTRDIALKSGVECPFIRPVFLSEDYVSLELVQKYSLEQIEDKGYFPDLVVHLEETFPFRSDGMIDNMIDYLLMFGYDTVIASRRESAYIWQENQDERFLKQIDSGMIPRDFKEYTMIGMQGVGCITHPEFLRSERILGRKTGLFNVTNPLSGFEVRDDYSASIAEKFFQVNP